MYLYHLSNLTDARGDDLIGLVKNTFTLKPDFFLHLESLRYPKGILWTEKKSFQIDSACKSRKREYSAMDKEL